MLQVMLPLFCYCQLDNFAWGTRGIDASEASGQNCKDLVEKKPYEVALAMLVLSCLFAMLVLPCCSAMLVLPCLFCHACAAMHGLQA